MSELDIEIKVISAPPPKGPKGPSRLMRALMAAARAALMRPRRLRLSILALFVLLVGTPHVGWDYECRHTMRGPGTCRDVHWCAYYGVQGRRIEFPDEGQSCKLVTFIPLDFQALIGG